MTRRRITRRLTGLRLQAGRAVLPGRAVRGCWAVLAGWAGLAGCAVLAGCLVLAGCGRSPGSVSGAASSQPAAAIGTSSRPAALCTHVAVVASLAVTRTNAAPRNGVGFDFPAQVTVTDPTGVRQAARVLCALPLIPHRALLCAGGPMISYRLRFSAPGVRIPGLTASPANCQLVTGLGTTRLALPRFWRALGEAMRVVHPGEAAFRGTPGGSRPSSAGPSPTPSMAP